jgi:hypothetical protein
VPCGGSKAHEEAPRFGWRVSGQQVRHGAPFKGCKLHLPELVDEDRVGWNPQRRKGEPLELSDGDS